jgi:hypothetical protein
MTCLRSSTNASKRAQCLNNIYLSNIKFTIENEDTGRQTPIPRHESDSMRRYAHDIYVQKIHFHRSELELDKPGRQQLQAGADHVSCRRNLENLQDEGIKPKTNSLSCEDEE